MEQDVAILTIRAAASGEKTAEAILSRRSCRKYSKKDVPKEIMDDIILAGRSAPTGLNRQNIKFYVIHNNAEKVKSIG